MITRMSPLHEKPIEGVVLEKNNLKLQVVVRDYPPDLIEGHWVSCYYFLFYGHKLASCFHSLHYIKRLDKGANRVSYDRMIEALTKFTTSKYSSPPVLPGIPLSNISSVFHFPLTMIDYYNTTSFF